MLGEAGYFTALPEAGAGRNDRRGEGDRAGVGVRAIMQLSEVEAAMRESRTKKTKTVCTYAGWGCSFDIWTRDRHILKVEPAEGPANGISSASRASLDGIL